MSIEIIVFLSVSVIGIVIWLAVAVVTAPRAGEPRTPEKEVKHLSMERVPGNLTDRIITATYTSGEVRRFRGSGTVWRAYPEGTRQTLRMELWLSDVYTRLRWEEDAKK